MKRNNRLFFQLKFQRLKYGSSCNSFADLSASTLASSVLYTTTRVAAFQSIIQAVAPLLNVFRFPSTTWNKYKSLLTWPLRPYGFNLCRSLAASPPFIAHLILFAPLTVAFFLSLEHIKLIAMSELCLAFCSKCSFLVYLSDLNSNSHRFTLLT